MNLFRESLILQSLTFGSIWMENLPSDHKRSSSDIMTKACEESFNFVSILLILWSSLKNLNHSNVLLMSQLAKPAWHEIGKGPVRTETKHDMKFDCKGEHWHLQERIARNSSSVSSPSIQVLHRILARNSNIASSPLNLGKLIGGPTLAKTWGKVHWAGCMLLLLPLLPLFHFFFFFRSL